MLFERGDGGEGVGGEVAGAEVAEGVEFFAELEEALFRADGTGTIFLFVEEVSGSAWEECVYGEGKQWEGRRRESRAMRTGPPIAPKRTASAFLAAARASSVRGEPVASMEAWDRFVSWKWQQGVCLESVNVPRRGDVLRS